MEDYMISKESCEKMRNNKVGICLISNRLSGAEKRIIRIFIKLSASSEDYLLLINDELFALAKNDIEFSNFIEKMLSNNKLIVLENISYKKAKIIKTIITNVKMYKTVKTHNVRVVHLVLSAIQGSFGCKLAGSKVIFEVTSPDVAKSVTKGSLKFFSSLIDKFIAVSPTVENILVSNWNKNNKKKLIEKIKCSSIPYFNKPMKNCSYDAKENLIVYASRFIERKNPLLFAKAVKMFLANNEEWKIAILGSGPLENEIKNELLDEINDKRVSVEQTNNIYSYFEKSKIFVSLIYPDNYPSQSILEAMSMRNAIIATNVGSTDKFVNKKNGILVEEFNKEAVVNAIIQLTSDLKLLKIMGDESLDKVKNKFSSDKYIDELVETYDLMKRNPKI